MQTSLGTRYKDPNAKLDYKVDWSLWLTTGDEIASVTWTVPAGLTNEAVANTTTTATIWLSGGTLDASYDVACKVTTTDGRIDERTFRIYVINR